MIKKSFTITDPWAVTKRQKNDSYHGPVSNKFFHRQKRRAKVKYFLPKNKTQMW